MNRLNDMLDRYGECVSKAEASRILHRTQVTITNMLKDGRLRHACMGTMVDVRSIAEYIDAPRGEDMTARYAKQAKHLQPDRFKA